ncbi:MAG: SIS domain-containing protein [Patescibacteria group bacterium]|nr:SIS domain-containing protein [Patescibacteria group bacterium]
MNKLNNLEQIKKQIKKLDPDRVLESIEMVGEQVSQVWQECKKIRLPKSYRKINKVIINGMGGSALGGHILKSVFFDQLKVPVDVINNYQLPASLNKNTLYIISSYSGNTEEPLAAFNEAQKRGAKIFGITSGGKLGRWIKQGKMPGYIFEPNFNPSGQPRMGLGYSLAAQMALLKKAGLIQVSDSEIKKVLATIDRLNAKFSINNLSVKNTAKKLAQRLVDNSLAVVASEFLAGSAHVFANQTNETGKTFSTYFLIPELNHHLLEGLKYPRANRQNLLFVFLESKLYFPKNQLRLKITQKVMAKNKIKYEVYKMSAASKLEQSFEALLLSSYATFYLAILNNLNPNIIPWVDYFKEQLKKSK